VNFAERETGRIYLRIESGRPAWVDPEPLARALSDADARAALSATLPAAVERAIAHSDRPRNVAHPEDGRPIHTLGRWGFA